MIQTDTHLPARKFQRFFYAAVVARARNAQLFAEPLKAVCEIFVFAAVQPGDFLKVLPKAAFGAAANEPAAAAAAYQESCA